MTSFAPAPSSAYRRVRLRDFWTTLGIISLLAGLLTNIRFQFGGKASVGEIAFGVVALFALLANIGNPRFWNRRMVVILIAMFVTLGGYVVSDLINAVPSDRFVRGWARMTFMIVDFLAVWALARNSIVNLFAICVGDSLSTLLTYAEGQHDFLYIYKFHLAMPATVLIMITIPYLMPRRANMATGIAMAAVGMFHFALDFRMLGAICVLIGFVLIARGITASRFRRLYLTLLALALTLSSTAIGYVYTVTQVSFSERRQNSNSERMSLALAGINAIERSPVIGLGSWVWDAEMWNTFAGNKGRSNISSQQARESQGPHSQLLQAWAEAGLLGLVFFLYLGKLLCQALWILLFRRPLDVMMPLFLYYLLLGLWNLLFSPFANLHRFDIALSLMIVIQVLRERMAVARAIRV